MTRIAFFGHDAGDAAVRRRVAAFHDTGYDVTGFMMRRGEDAPREWANIDLGQTHDAAYWQRLAAIRAGVKVTEQYAEQLRSATLIYARNLDMLICAMWAQRALGLDLPVIYECLDVHHLLTRRDPLGLVLRRIERRLIRKTRLLVFSSPAFEREFFQKHYAGLYTPYLLENRLIEHGKLPARPALTAPQTGRLRIGWFGVLRCKRTLHMLAEVARRFPEHIEIVVAGIPAATQVPEFEEIVSAADNITFLGKYQSPEDLEKLYGQVDLVWAGDYYQAGHNSRWLLPNRIYEGGYFNVPAIAPDETETGKWLIDREVGFTVSEPVEEALPTLVAALLEDTELITCRQRRLGELERPVFVQPRDEMQRLIETALDTQRLSVA